MKTDGKWMNQCKVAKLSTEWLCSAGATEAGRLSLRLRKRKAGLAEKAQEARAKGGQEGLIDRLLTKHKANM